jgi:hypothetical protein
LFFVFCFVLDAFFGIGNKEEKTRKKRRGTPRRKRKRRKRASMPDELE